MTHTDDVMALDMEYRLTLAHRIGCECSRYFARRWRVLMPAVLERATRTGEDVVDLFARFARGVHQRHLDGLPLATPTRAAIAARKEEG